MGTRLMLVIFGPPLKVTLSAGFASPGTEYSQIVRPPGTVTTLVGLTVAKMQPAGCGRATWRSLGFRLRRRALGGDNTTMGWKDCGKETCTRRCWLDSAGFGLCLLLTPPVSARLTRAFFLVESMATSWSWWDQIA